MTWTDDDLNLALSKLKDEPLPPGAGETVRARVLGEIGKPRRAWWMWAWAPALAAGLVIWAVVPSRDGRAPLQERVSPSLQEDFSPPLRAGTGAGVAVGTGSGALTKPGVIEAGRGGAGGRSIDAQSRSVSDGLPAAVPARFEKETRFVKLVTDDPDVVILWALNSEGDAQ